MHAADDVRLRRLDQLLGVMGAIALLVLIRTYGVPDLPSPSWLRSIWPVVLTVGLFLEAIYRLLWVKDPWLYVRRHPVRYVILLVILLELSGISSWKLAMAGSGQSVSKLTAELFLAVLLLGYAGSWAQGAVLANRWLASCRIPVLALPTITFAAAILVGGAFLSLPGLHQEQVPFIDNLFTSTSAVCVTGLAVYDISHALTGVGQLVLMLLIQLGGLGTLTILAMLSLWRRGQLSVGEKVAYEELVGGVSRAEVKQVIATIVRYTLIVELLGAFALGALSRGRTPRPWLKGAFHAVSAFCNAGFALFSDSFESFRSDIPTLTILMLLIIAGGAGFSVLADLARTGLTNLIPWMEPERLRKASKLVLLTSGTLIVAGTLLFLADGWWEGTGRTPLEALFQSVTTRTAGFQVESQLRFGFLGIISALSLMVIGASPQSTGGGIKTTVLARLVVDVDSEPRAEGRRLIVLSEHFRTAAILAAAYILVGAISAWTLVRTDALSVRDAAFESFSAVGTVGLSRDVTPQLSVIGKCIDMLLMFIGRVIYPTAVIWLIRRRGETEATVPWT